MSYGSPVAEVDGIDRATFAAVAEKGRPVVFRGLARDWPAVRAGADLPGYLRDLAGDATCDLIEASAAVGGKLGYDAGLTGFNFTRTPTTLTLALDRIAAAGDTAAAVQALPAPPAFAAANPAPLLAGDPAPRLWLGTPLVVAVHHDLSRNLAVVVAGRRRFILFPPAAVADLYLGPLEFSPAGTPISLVDATDPDLDGFPRFAAAMSVAEVAELGPGDAIYIPYMWWHGVESFGGFGALANYWWSETPPPQPGLAPIDALLHARLAFSAMTAEQRAAWRAMFDHIVFDEAVPDHLPRDRRGIRGGIGDAARTRLRRQLGAVLSR